MLKLRYFYLSLIIYYIVFLGVVLFVETLYVKYASVEIKEALESASERAIEQTQYLDDFLAFRDEDSYNLYMPTNTAGKYAMTNVLEAMWGVEATSEDDLELVYDSLYNNEELRELLNITNEVRMPIRYYDTRLNEHSYTLPSSSWYTLPRAFMLGEDFLQRLSVTPSLYNLESLEGKTTEEDKLKDLLKSYGLDKNIRETDQKKYFSTPLNNGITYLNRDLLSSLFINSLDLKMRSKYFGTTEVEGGIGCTNKDVSNKTVFVDTITCGLGYNNLITGENELQEYNPMNNGVFTVLRYDSINTSSSGILYEGVKPTIEYKIVDMHNATNDVLLRSLFGGFTDEGDYGYSKSNYLRKVNMGKYANYDNVVKDYYKEYPFIVAKITFKADIIVPYVTPTMRGIAGRISEGNSVGNFLDIWTDDVELVNDLGVRRFEHTVLFAVSP